MDNRELERVFEHSISLLTPREHSEGELRQKLLKRGYEIEYINAAIAKLKHLDYLSDERFTELYIAQRIRKGDGPAKIRANLHKRGVSSELVTSFLTSDDEFWIGIATKAIQKRLNQEHKALEHLSNTKWQTLYRFLSGRGFSPAHARAVLGLPPRK